MDSMMSFQLICVILMVATAVLGFIGQAQKKKQESESKDKDKTQE